ncbi:MAG: rhodanese-like domain-containing protein [Cellulosilyticaceae bacterium]
MGLFNTLFNTSNTIRSISPEEANQTLATNKNIILIDVREPHEFMSGHIKESKNLPVGNIQNSISSVASDTATPLYIYCRSGARSARACQALVAKGYTNVYNLGGIMSWPYDIVR